MKKLFLSGCLVLGLAQLIQAQPQPVYENDGNFQSPPAVPPQIDATTFINKGAFDVTFNSLGSGSVSTTLVGVVLFDTLISPFDFSDTVYYTNRGTMACDTGFTFDTAPANTGFRQMAGSFGNANTGQIFAGSATNGALSSLDLVIFGGPGLFFSSGTPTLKVWATNVLNRGLMDVGSDGFVTVNGMGVDLVRGTIHVEGFDDASITSSIGTIGILDDYHGFGLQTNSLNLFGNVQGIPGNLSLSYPESPINLVTNIAAQPTLSLVAPSPYGTAFANMNQDFSGSNVYVQVVYINTNLGGISTDVRFLGGGSQFGGGFTLPIIQWQAIITNYTGFGTTYTTNDLYLEDIYGVFQTNYLVTNSFSFSGVPQPMPYNYSFSRYYSNYSTLPKGNTPFDQNMLYTANNAFPATNAYSAYGVTLSPVSDFPDSTLPGSTFTNIPGRIEITAGTSIDLTSSTITGPNYLYLNSTNHFVGSSNATIVSPYMDVYLGSTNGNLSISNLVAPYVSRFSGPIDMWSGRWTNVVNGITNHFHVLIVNAQITPTSLPTLLDCSLRATNVTISDILNVQNSLLINATSLTITSNNLPFGNTGEASGQFGELNLLTPNVIWSNSFPGLLCLTNFGLISAQNATYFQGQAPFYPGNTVLPYNEFMNYGLITSDGDLISANYFQNVGLGSVISNSTSVATTTNYSAVIFSGVGPVTITAYQSALMLKGAIVAAGGDLDITSPSITVSNHILYTSGELTLSASTLLTDTGIAGSNFWSVGDGMNLPQKPAAGDLLGTTITNYAPVGVEVDNIWAATDRGATPAGFSNNAAIGHLILDGGGDNSAFYFAGPGPGQYALYVDLLDLRDGATNRVSEGGIPTFTAFDIASNMTIYYADAVVGGTLDVSEKLNGADNGHLVWVPAYAGAFSSTNLIYPAGVTNAFNRALVSSTDIDSSGTGVYNAYNPTPIYTAHNVGLSMGMTNAPSQTPILRWSGLANSTNIIFFKGNLSSNWTAISTNIEGPLNGAMTFIDHGRTNRAGYYKVEVQPQQP